MVIRIQYFNKIFLRLIFFLIWITCPIRAQEKKQIEILHANTIEFDKNSGTNAKKLKGNVQFRHENAIMYCDSAYFYSEKNFIDAFGNIRIHQGDTLHLFGELLKYDGNTKIAKVRKHVKLIDKESTLTTENLDFKIAEDIGNYINGGKIVNGENTLTSEIGYYYAKQKMFYYRKNVVINNPKYLIKSDTLKYNTVSKIAYFFGPTNITSKEDFIYCENGWYNTSTNISQFNKNAYLKSNKQLLKGDSLYYERDNGIGKAFKNIWLIDSSQQVIITGNYARYHEKPEYAMITDSSVFMYYNDKDTMYVHADTLISVADSSGKEKIVRAYFHVKIFKQDMQGKCDSLTYTTADSTIRLFHLPVLWSDENQLTSDFIELHMANKRPNTADLYGNSFIISMADSNKFNQIKGRKMTGFFKDNELHKVDVFGNGQTIYFAPEKDEIIGMNKAESSNLIIFIEKRKIKKIEFLTKPSAILYPIIKAPIEELKFRDFKWYTKSRPDNKNEIFFWQDE